MKAVTLERQQTLAKSWVGVPFFTALMIVSANIKIPLFFTPIPVTLQTLVLFLSIVFLNDKAFLSQLCYIFLGITGLPVFSNNGGGLFYLLGPTGGYIVGFFVAALLVPYVLFKVDRFWPAFASFALCSAIYYFFGIAWLMVGYKFSYTQAISLGFLPFIVFDLLKICLATAIYKKFKN